MWFYRGSGPILLRNPIFCDFWGGDLDPLAPPLDPHMAPRAQKYRCICRQCLDTGWVPCKFYSKVSIFLLVSVAEQVGMSLTWSETTKLKDRFICHKAQISLDITFEADNSPRVGAPGLGHSLLYTWIGLHTKGTPSSFQLW